MRLKKDYFDSTSFSFNDVFMDPISESGALTSKIEEKPRVLTRYSALVVFSKRNLLALGNYTIASFYELV